MTLKNNNFAGLAVNTLKIQQLLHSQSPVIMGILNITPNSASSVGRFLSVDLALKHAEKMIQQGAAIIDVGGEATNPGTHPVTELDEELKRVIPVIAALNKEFSVPISVDTSKTKVMQEAVAAGAAMINDVRALIEPGALEWLASTPLMVCLMHMAFPHGKITETSCKDPDIVASVKQFLASRVEACLKAGILRENLILDPGIGHGNFGKNLDQNLSLLKNLAEFKEFNLPLLVGVSRKTFIGELLGQPVEERLFGSIGASVVAAINGASIIRTHDVQETLDAVKVAMAIQLHSEKPRCINQMESFKCGVD
jgi:dihydropteroate synthase